jgi:beta-lactam-binding protein with PASTA domain
MARVFSVTAASDTVPLDAAGRGEIAFTVSNASGRHLRGRARVVPQDPAQRSWLTIAGEPERDFPVGGVQQFTVQVAVPAGTPEGRHTFRLDAVSVQNPDEDYTQGPTVAFTVAKHEERKRFPWWIAAAAVAVLAIGGVSTWLILRGRMEVPAITGKTLADANSVVAPVNLKIGNVTSVLTSSANVDKVLRQNPQAGQKLRSGGSIDVDVGVAIVVVPMVAGKMYNDAVTALHAAFLDIGQVSNVNSPGVLTPTLVLDSNPKAGNSLKSHSTVDLVIQQQNVPVPDVIGQSFPAAVARLTAANLKLGTVSGNIYQVIQDGGVMRGVGLTAAVTDQNPKGVTVPVGSQVNLVFPNGSASLNPLVANRVAAKAAHW